VIRLTTNSLKVKPIYDYQTFQSATLTVAALPITLCVMNILPQTCAFVAISDVVKFHNLMLQDLRRFWGVLVDSPFSWGCNNRSMVTASSLADYLQIKLGNEPLYVAVIESLRELGELYVDLEN
jgi:hypothetical protein